MGARIKDVRYLRFAVEYWVYDDRGGHREGARTDTQARRVGRDHQDVGTAP